MMEGPTSLARHFVIPCNTAPHDGVFSVNEPTRGRLDMVARVLTSAIFLSNGTRVDTTISLVFTGPVLNFNARGCPNQGQVFVWAV